MLQSIGGNLANVTVVTKAGESLCLKVGQVFEAVVAAQENEQFWVKIGETLLPVRSETALSVGQRIKLQVMDFRGEELLVKKIPLTEVEEAQQKEQQLIKLIEKFGGFKEEKTLSVIKQMLAKLPVDEQTAVRYLLDPNLFTAVLISRGKEGHDTYDQLEITKYQGTVIKQEMWEACFELALPVLGQIEIKIRMVGECLYTQLWAGLPETEKKLRAKQSELEFFCKNIEIIPGAEGPLFKSDYLGNIDFMV